MDLYFILNEKIRKGGMKRISIIATVLFFTVIFIQGCTLLGIGGQGKSNTDGFAVYLPTQALTASQMNQKDLSKIKLTDTPLVSQDDIISYERSTHIIHLKTSALTAVYNETLKVSTGGEVFVVCVNRQPVYWGLIWTTRLPVMPPDDKVILIVYQTIENAASSNSIPAFIQLTYQGNNDPRSNPLIFDTLAKADKLQ
jgi:hypothetical protein